MNPPHLSWIDDLLKFLTSELIQQELIPHNPTPEEKEKVRQLILDRANPIIKARKELKKHPFFLFVDIDGCLNNSTSPDWELKTNNMVLDPTSLNNYFELIRFLSNLFQLKILLSSGWKLYPTHLEYLKENSVIWDDITPTKLTSTRSQEIRMSLKEQLDLPDEFDIMTLDNFLVLDDQLLPVDWGKKLINCSFFEGGFTEKLLQETKEYIFSIYPSIKQ